MDLLVTLLEAKVAAKLETFDGTVNVDAKVI